MSKPSVCCVMLTADRPELARRAVEAFRAQTYERKRLFIWDTSADYLMCLDERHANELQVHMGSSLRAPIGVLRNRAIAYAFECDAPYKPDIICHFDDDDYSHPGRIDDQVALLESTGADLVGYDQMLFWRDETAPDNTINHTGEAWLYTGSILGTSMCYRRKTWERVPFRAHGEDNEDIGFEKDARKAGMKVVTVSSFPGAPPDQCIVREFEGTRVTKYAIDAPRMIARIHAGNAKNPSYDLAQMRAHPQHWKRVPEWDAYCRSVMS